MGLLRGHADDRHRAVVHGLGLLRHHLQREILRVVIRVDALLARGAGLALPCSPASHRVSVEMAPGCSTEWE